MKRKWCVVMVAAVAVGICLMVWAESASVLLEKGIYAEETAGNLDEAIKIYKQIVDDANANRNNIAEAYYRLGKCYLKKGQEQKAVAVFEEMIASFPEQKEIIAQISQLPCMQSRLKAKPPSSDEKEQLAKAEELIRLGGELKAKQASYEELRIELEKAKTELQRAEAQYKAGRLAAELYDDARANEKILEQKAKAVQAEIETIEAVIELKKKSGSAIESEEYAAKGWKLWQERKLADAQEVFERAVQLDPTNANAWNGLGWSQFNQGKPQAAKVSFEKCLAAEPKHAAALNGLGWIAKNEGKTDDAIHYWEKAIEALPSATAALNGLATTYMELQQYEKAIQYYEQWLKYEPESRFAKTGLEKAKAALAGEAAPAVDEKELRRLIAELDDPNAPRFEALNLIVQMGKPAVPMLIAEMITNNNWQIPKALGAIGDERAVEPLIEKLEKCNWSPMKEVVAEALNRITAKDFGENAAAWKQWWNTEGSKTHKNEQPPGAAVDESTLSRQRDAALGRGDLIGACDAEMQRVLYRKKIGHAYKDKIDLAGLYEQRAQSLSHEQKEKYLTDAVAYLDQHKGQEEYEWRIWHLLSSIAADLGQKDKAAEYLDQALLAYPEVSYPDPSVHSMFHHLVNQRASMIWETDGVEAAEEYFLNQLKSNKKCEYFFPLWWEKQYEKEELNERPVPMLERVKDAYSLRMKTFPDKKALIEKYVSYLNEHASQIQKETKSPQIETEGVAETIKWFLAGSRRGDYEIGEDTEVTRTGKPTSFIKAKDSAQGVGFGTMMQQMPPGTYLGKRVRLSGYVKNQDVGNWAGLWMRVDGPAKELLSFDNMSTRPIKGTSDWKNYEIVLDVPETSVNIAFGILLAGKGQVWLDDLKFEIVGKDVPTTGLR
jgi:tetratricopeptide (TPR) repeat protein